MMRQMQNTQTSKAPKDPAPAAFDLRSFFPYLVRIYYRSVSDSVKAIYTSRFNLSVSEWRTMSVLGTEQALSASEIVEASSMDKVAVSRAIQGLRKSGMLKRDIDGDDRRRAVLRLTEKGADAFNTLIPLIQELEAELLNGLSEEERQTLIRLMAKVRANAEGLAKQA